MWSPLFNKITSLLFYKELPTLSNSFAIQRNIFSHFIKNHLSSPLYQNLWIKQVQARDITTSNDIKHIIAQYPFVEYTHIHQLLHQWTGITQSNYDLCIKTSWTSDAINGGKLIPANRSSLDIELSAIRRTLGYYLQENTHSSLFHLPYFSLTAPFDEQKSVGYVSWAIKTYSKTSLRSLLSRQHYPISTYDRSQTYEQNIARIVDEILVRKPYLWSFHGVPTRWLDIIKALIATDRQAASRILSKMEYISIGGGAPQDNKIQFAGMLAELSLQQPLYASNNHNASEWFLAAQARSFVDLSYHWMSPMVHSQFFLFIPYDSFVQYEEAHLSYQEMISSYARLLHEVQPGIEYLIMFANDRIPRLYNIKDVVIFKDNYSDRDILEYQVVGRYGMSSNVCNEHIEINHIITVLQNISQSRMISQHDWIAGMEKCDDNNYIFHIVIEPSQKIYNSSLLRESDSIRQEFDHRLWLSNEQWTNFRLRKKIADLAIHIVPEWTIRQWLVQQENFHPQSKLPQLHNNNYSLRIKPLLNSHLH